MSLTYLSGENYSQDLHDKRHENRLYIITHTNVTTT